MGVRGKENTGPRLLICAVMGDQVTFVLGAEGYDLPVVRTSEREVAAEVRTCASSQLAL